MSGVDAYLLELSAAIGHRLPPEVREARLREARAHLLASAEEVGEAEAFRRYGRARAVAGGLVRAHRGYGGASAWSLASPLSAPLFGTVAFWAAFCAQGPSVGWAPTLIAFARLESLLVAAAFAARVVQTRRWLAGPMVAAYLAGMAALGLLALLDRGRAGATGSPTLLVAELAAVSAAWPALNALGLGLGRLLDGRGAA